MLRRNATLVAGACLVLALSLGTGFWLDADSFESNVLAELAGVVLGIGVAVFVVERLVDRDRRARWHLVATETIKTLRFALVRAAMPLYLQLPAPRPNDADPFTMYRSGKLGDGLRALSAKLRDAEPRSPEELKPGLLREVLNDVAPHLDFIQDMIMQRLLTVGPDPELIKRLAVLESTREDVDHAAWIDERFGSRPGQNTERMADLVDSIRDVVTYLDATPP